MCMMGIKQWRSDKLRARTNAVGFLRADKLNKAKEMLNCDAVDLEGEG